MEMLDRPPARPLKTLAMADCIGCHQAWRWPEPTRATEAAPVRVAARGPVSTDCNACHR
jgi:cytochrome c556